MGFDTIEINLVFIIKGNVWCCGGGLDTAGLLHPHFPEQQAGVQAVHDWPFFLCYRVYPLEYW